MFCCFVFISERENSRRKREGRKERWRRRVNDLRGQLSLGLVLYIQIDLTVLTRSNFSASYAGTKNNNTILKKKAHLNHAIQTWVRNPGLMESLHKGICNGTHCKIRWATTTRERGSRDACRDNAVSSLNPKQSDAFNAQNNPTDNNEDFTIAISFQ